METLSRLLATAAAASVISGIFNLITTVYNRKAAKKDESADKLSNLTKGTRILLYMEIKSHARRYIEEKCISTEDLEDIVEMHKIYHDELGGNGFLDSVMHQVKKLPIHDYISKGE